MAEIIRHPIVLAPNRRRRLADQSAVAPAVFDALIRRQDRRIEAAGGPALGPEDLRFITACKDGVIKPRDIAGADRRAIIARRIIRDLNAQGAAERNEPNSG